MVEAGTNVRKWFRLLRFSFFPPMWCISWKKNCHYAVGVKHIGIDFDLNNKIPKISTPLRQGFDFQSAPQQNQQTFEVSGHSRFPLFMSL